MTWFEKLLAAAEENKYIRIPFKDGQIAPHEKMLRMDGGGETFYVKPSPELVKQSGWTDEMNVMGINYEEVNDIEILDE